MFCNANGVFEKYRSNNISDSKSGHLRLKKIREDDFYYNWYNANLSHNIKWKSQICCFYWLIDWKALTLYAVSAICNLCNGDFFLKMVMYTQINFKKHTEDVVLIHNSKPRTASAMKSFTEVCGINLHIRKWADNGLLSIILVKGYYDRNTINITTLNMCLYMFQS